jgi:hypothetical protein
MKQNLLKRWADYLFTYSSILFFFSKNILNAVAVLEAGVSEHRVHILREVTDF